MTERPILFNAPMVRAILNGSKTQTRRVVKQELKGIRGLDWGECQPLGGFGADIVIRPENKIIKCPYGQVGDELWVRETWGIAGDMPHDAGYIEYKANCSSENFNSVGDLIPRWKPSIHMPRRASRIQLRITNIRVERLNEISEADAKAEGICLQIDEAASYKTYKAGFAHLWESINGLSSWIANPWVWVIEFERVQP